MTDAPGTRTRRLYIRLTSDEAAWLESAAAIRGLTISDLVREAVLKRRSRVGRRTLPPELADLVRRLTLIGLDLRQLVVREEAASPGVAADCLFELRATLEALRP